MKTRTKIGMITALPIAIALGILFTIYWIIKWVVLKTLLWIGFIEASVYILEAIREEMNRREFMKTLSEDDRKIFS